MADDKNKKAAADKAAKEAEAKAQKEAQLKAQKEAADAKKAKERAQKEAQLKAQKEAEAAQKAKEAEAKAQKEAQLKAQKDAEAAQKAKERAQKEAQLKAQKEAEAKANEEAQLKAQKEAQLKARKEAEAAQKAKMQREAAAASAAKKAEPAQPAAQNGKQKPPKMTRKEKKELLKRQLAREKELVEAGEIPLRNKYRPRGFFWRVLGICLAFFMGIFATVGGVVGAGAILLGGPSRDLLNQFGFKAEQYISEEYLDKSVFEIYDELVKEMNALSGNPGDLTLENFSKYTPLLDTYIDQLVDQNLKELGVALDLSELRTTPFGQLGTYVKTGILPQIEVGPVLRLNTGVTPKKIKDNAPMYALSYGKLGVDYTIANGTDNEGNPDTVVKMLDGKKPKNILDLIPTLAGDDYNGVQPTAAEQGTESGDNGMLGMLGGIDLGSFLGLDIKLDGEEATGDSSMVYTLCYGTEGKNYQFEALKDSEGNTIAGCQVLKMIGDSKATSVNTLIDDSTGFIEGLPLGEMLGLNSAESLANRADNSMMYVLCYGTEGVDYDVVDDRIVMRAGHEDKETSLSNLTNESTDFLKGLPLGEMLGLNSAESLADKASNAMMYVLCYGKEGVDYDIDNGHIVMKDGKIAHTLGDLTDDSTDFLKTLPLGEMLGLNTTEQVADRDSNSMMYALCYGAEGEDYDVVEGLIKMREGHDETLLGDLTDGSNEVIDGMYVDVVLGIKPESDSILRTVAYGNEMQKDGEGNYMKDPDNPSEYLTELVLGDDGEPEKDEQGEPTGRLQYAGGGKYIIEGQGDAAKVVMLPDPNDPDGKLYPKKTIGDLTAADANLLEGVTLGSLLNITEESSQIMQSMATWDLDDLKDEKKIESLTIEQLVDLGETPSGIMNAMRTWTIADFNNQEKIENELYIGDVVGDASSGIMKAMRTWTIGDLNKQEKIESLKIGEILDGDTSSGILEAMSDWSIADLKDQEKIESLKIGQIVDLGDSPSGILSAMKEWTIGNLNQQNRIERLKIGQIIDLGDNPSGILRAMEDWRISDLNDQKKIDSLTLGSVISIEDGTSPKMLLALKDMSLGEISTSIDSLYISDVLDIEPAKGNRIIALLQNKQIKNLATVINDLTIEQVFGDDIWSFAKHGKIQDGVRVSDDNRISRYQANGIDEVEPFTIEYEYFHEGTQVYKHPYISDGHGGWKKVDENAVVNEAHFDREVEVTYAPEYYIVDYDKAPAEWQLFSGSEEIKHDDPFTDYYLDADDVRHDLDKRDVYKENGVKVEGKRILNKESGSGTIYYYVVKEPVTYRYSDQDETATYSESEITIEYYITTDTLSHEHAERYLAGVWYLLLTDDRGDYHTGLAYKITEMDQLVTNVTAKINKITLHDMYIHELINADPDVPLSDAINFNADLNGDGQPNEKVTNINQLTVSQVIDLVKYINRLLSRSFPG